jgi:integrase/recombinase XerC
MEELDKSPARVLKQRRLPTYIERDKAMTDDELARVLEQVRFNPAHRAIILFLADTGARAGGAAGLTLDNLMLPERRARVTEKGDKSRLVAFGDNCALAMTEWLLRRPHKAGIYVFSRSQKPLTSDSISQIVRRACLAAGVRSLGSHSLRHRKGHQLADNRVAPSVAATALGHSDPVITLRHYYPADWESAERELRKLTTPDSLAPRVPAKIIRIANGQVIIEESALEG